MPETKRWNVTTSGDRSLSDVKEKLSQEGFNVDQVLEEIGIITGDASDDIAEKLRKVPGVTDVSPEIGIDIGPPDAPVTW